jgi:hypothetical protein
MVIVCATTTRVDHSPAGKRRDKRQVIEETTKNKMEEVMSIF